MLLRFLLFFGLIFNYSLNLYSDEKESIINKFSKINNFTFNFEQNAYGRIERGTCYIVFDDKLKCIYSNNSQKEIIINDNTLVVLQKKYNKVYFYPVTKSPFVKILKKNSLIRLIRESYLELNDNIDLVYFDEKEKKITLFFEKKKFELVGWEVEDELQNEIFFSLKILSINTVIKDNFFKIPPIN